MGPKHKLITLAWCSLTMTATMILSHGHLIMKEIMLHWPVEDSWEGRLESALYTQGGLVFLASCVIGLVIVVRGYFAKLKDEELLRKELLQREKHERAAASRHEAMLDAFSNLSGGLEAKKLSASGVKPR